jgi:hypothetical protein
LIQVARDEKLDRIVATILLENMGMRALASRFGFVVEKSSEMDVVKAGLILSGD